MDHSENLALSAVVFRRVLFLLITVIKDGLKQTWKRDAVPAL